MNKFIILFIFLFIGCPGQAPKPPPPRPVLQENPDDCRNWCHNLIENLQCEELGLGHDVDACAMDCAHIVSGGAYIGLRCGMRAMKCSDIDSLCK